MLAGAWLERERYTWPSKVWVPRLVLLSNKRADPRFPSRYTDPVITFKRDEAALAHGVADTDAEACVAEFETIAVCLKGNALLLAALGVLISDRAKAVYNLPMAEETIPTY